MVKSDSSTTTFLVYSDYGSNGKKWRPYMDEPGHQAETHTLKDAIIAVDNACTWRKITGAAPAQFSIVKRTVNAEEIRQGHQKWFQYGMRVSTITETTVWPPEDAYE